VTPRVAWLFSLTRSGSSAAVYASANALGWAVADEPFGPWDRTGPPYHYPPEQVRLHRDHLAAGERLTDQTNDLFQTVVESIAATHDAPGVIVKLPHDMIEPRDVAAFRPTDTCAYLIRNPLSRLNSIYTRGWEETVQHPFDIERVKLFTHRIMRAPRSSRVRFEMMQQTPRRFFRRLWRAWAIDFDEDQIEAAVRYRARHYHESSAQQQPGRNPHRVLSEHRRAVPAEAVACLPARPGHRLRLRARRVEHRPRPIRSDHMKRRMARDLGIVFAAAAGVRVVALLTLPLIITNDGSFYLQWGTTLAGGQWPDLPAYRTPGYPLWNRRRAHRRRRFRARSARQPARCSAWPRPSRAGGWVEPRSVRGPGALAGLAVALDPWLLAISSFALSDILSIAFPLVALALVVGRPGLTRASLAGLLVGVAVLTRPTAVAWVPGMLALAAVTPAARPRLRWLRPCAAAVACMLTIAPWAAVNASRGIPGIARTEGLAMWGGLARSGRLARSFELPEQLRPLAEPLFEHTPPEHAVMRFYSAAGTVDGVDRGRLLSEWSRTSLRADPVGYARAVVHTLAWQANARLPASPYGYDSLRWMMRRLGGTNAIPDASANVSTRQLPDLVSRFQDGPATGPLGTLYRTWDLGMKQRYPQLPLGLLTLVAIGLAVYRKRWQLAIVLASSFPIVAGHAIILQPFSRYSLSAWLVWWLGGVAAVALAMTCRRSAPSNTEHEAAAALSRSPG
jgi:hypothetical protein